MLHLINDFTRISIIYAAHSKKESFECSFNCCCCTNNNNSNNHNCCCLQQQLQQLQQCAKLCVLLQLFVCSFSLLYLDWQTFSTKTPHGARYKYKCGSCASNYLIGVNWRRLQAHCCCCYWLLLYAFLLAFSTCAVVVMLTWPKAADTVCNQVEILIYME